MFQNFRMKPCHTIYRKSGSDSKMCHLDLTIINNCHTFYFILIIRVLCLNLILETTVNFLGNLINSRKQTGE